MKFGVDPPWYDNPVERMAFNLYAMDCERLNEIAADAMLNNIAPEDIAATYGLKSQYELDYILERLGE